MICLVCVFLLVIGVSMKSNSKVNNKNKVNCDLESKTFLDASTPKETQTFEAKKELVKDMVSLIASFRETLPPRSQKYHKALTSIIISLNSYINYEEGNIGLWHGFDHLCMAHTYYSFLMYCTQPKNPNRDSNIQLELHKFLKDINSLWAILLNQYLDYTSRH